MPTGTYRKLYLALVAIRMRCNNADADLARNIITICEDTLQDAKPPEAEEKFDVVHVDGEPAFEVKVRALSAAPGVPDVPPPYPEEPLTPGEPPVMPGRSAPRGPAASKAPEP